MISAAAARAPYTSIHQVVLLLAACLLPLARSEARTQKSPEEVTAAAITAWTRMCAEENHGALPDSWTSYHETLRFALNEVLTTTLPTRRYAVLTPPLPLLPPLSGQMLVVNRSPIDDLAIPSGFLGLTHVLKGPGRYVIYRDHGGDFRYQWMPESYIGDTFLASHTPLPDPDEEPERPWVTQARQNMYLWRGIYGAALVILVAIAFVAQRRMGRTKEDEDGDEAKESAAESEDVAG